MAGDGAAAGAPVNPPATPAATPAATPEAKPSAVPTSGRPTLSRHARMRFDRSRGQHVLLGPEAVVVLNPTGADILELCDGQRSVAEVAAELHTRYDRVVDDEVAAFLARLVARGWMEVDDG